MSKKTLLYVVLALFCCSTLIVIGSTTNASKYHSQAVEKITQQIQDIEKKISLGESTPTDLEKLAFLKEQLADKMSLRDRSGEATSSRSSGRVTTTDDNRAAEADAEALKRSNPEYVDPAKLAASAEISARRAEIAKTGKAKSTLTGTMVDRKVARNAETVAKSEDPAVLRFKELEAAYREAKASGDEATAIRIENEMDGIKLPESSRTPIGSLDQGGDDCASATVIASLPYCDEGTTVGYTNDYMTPAECTGASTSGPEVVYSYTPAVDEDVLIQTGGSDFDTQIYIVTDCSDIETYYIACDDDDGPSTQSCMSSVSLTNGVTYYIIVDGYNGADGDYVLKMDVVGGIYDCDDPYTCSGPPTGRCCYGELYVNPTCEDGVTEDYCDGVTGEWLEGETCATEPCYVCTPTASAGSGEFEVVDANGTTDQENNIEPECLGSYGSGPEEILTWNVPVDATYRISLSSTGTYGGFAVATDCAATNCLLVVTNSSTSKESDCTFFTAGDYYIFVDTYSPSPDNLPDFVLSAEICPVGRCCYGTPEALQCQDIIEDDCLALTDYLSWDETLTCTTDPCDDAGRCCYGDNPQEPSCADETQFACLARANYLSWDGDLDCTTECPVILGRCCYGDETDPGFTGYDCIEETELECLARAEYISWTEGIDCSTPCPMPAVGRCCYGDEWTVDCVDEFEALCDLRSDKISWDDGMDCSSNPCEPVCDYTLEPVAATCDAAIELTPPAVRAGDISGGATLDPSLGYCGTYVYGPVVWYKVTGTGNTMTASFCDDCNINFDSIIRVYACACDLELIHCIGGNDYTSCDPASEAYNPATYSWCTNAGETYYIVAGAYSSSVTEGEFVLHVTDDGVACASPVGCPTGRCCYGDPQDPTCSADLTSVDCDVLAAGGYYEWTEGADCSGTPACEVILGRCCYGDPQDPDCADETEYECLLRADAITWDEGETCAYTPVTYHVTVYDDYYDPADIVVNQGDMVTWTWDAGVVNAHNVNSDDGTSFNSGTPVATPGFTFSHVFSDPVATYGYHCDNHPTMIGSVQVLAAPENTCAVVLGRCCYGDPLSQSCAYETEVECLNRADEFSWEEGVDCSEGCVNFVLGQNCSVPIEVTLDGATPYDQVVNTCGMEDDCTPAGEDMTYKLTVTVAGNYDISTCNPNTESNVEFDTYLKLFDECCGTTTITSNDTYSGCTANSDLARIECYYLDVGEYWLSLEVWDCCSTPLCGDVQLTILPCIGRCCYDDVFAPTCADGIGPDACEALGTASAGGYWSFDLGMDCSTTCPIPEDGDLCENQITVNTLPYTFSWDMCVYGGECSYYDHDTFFEIVIDHDGRYTISLCNSTAPGDAYMSLRSDGCCGSSYLYPTTTYCGDYREYACYDMTAGSYYLVVYQYTEDCGTLQLDIEECLEWRCCYGDPFEYACMDTTEAACADTGGVWTEFATCADPCVDCVTPVANDICSNIIGTCPTLSPGTPVIASGDLTCALWDNDCVNDPGEPGDTVRTVWECFELTECADVTISYCGSDAFGQGYVWVVLTTACDCSGGYISDDYAFNICPDGNPTVNFYNLPPGVYYHPVHRDRGPNYVVEFSATAALTGRCCYGDPMDLTCADGFTKCDCDDVSGSWLEGGNCIDNPCPEPCPILLSEYSYYTMGTYTIDDVTPQNIVVNVPDDFVIADINVGIDLVHTYDADIDLTLESPLGTIIELTTDNGGGNENFECTIFDMEATTLITDGTAPFTGSYIPEGDLSTLIGTSSLGDWTFHFVDDASGDAGTIYSVTIELISGECDPVEDLTIFYDIANTEFDLNWTNPQEAEYKVWSTSVPNNDGDPDDGSDPDWELEADLGILPAGPASMSILWADLPTDYANIVVTAGGCGPAIPTGRCCYDDGGPACADEITEEDCDLLGGEWTVNLNCTDNPCPISVGQGGEDCGTATVLSSIPATCTGMTTGFTDDYEEECDYTGSDAPDVCYSYSPTTTVVADLTLCVGITDYDTKLFIYEDGVGTDSAGVAPYACNDDECTAPLGQSYVSELTGITFTAGSNYCIVVDGYDGGDGNYTLEVSIP